MPRTLYFIDYPKKLVLLNYNSAVFQQVFQNQFYISVRDYYTVIQKSLWGREFWAYCSPGYALHIFVVFWYNQAFILRESGSVFMFKFLFLLFCLTQIKKVLNCYYIYRNRCQLMLNSSMLNFWISVTQFFLCIAPLQCFNNICARSPHNFHN